MHRLHKLSASFRMILFIEVLRHKDPYPGTRLRAEFTPMRVLPCQGRNKTSPAHLGKAPRPENIAAASLKLDDAEWKAIEDDAKQK